MAQELASLVQDGRVHRRVYTDPAIFAEEQRRIFRRVWLWLGHESQVRHPGDFFTARLAGDRVIVARHTDGRVHAFHNRCSHRGAQFAFACQKPRHTMHSGQPAIRMTAPPIVLGAQPGHGVKTPLPRPTEVRCDLRMGLQLFAARLVDVGLDGKAYIEGDPAIPVCDNTTLKGARLRPENAEALTVDLDVERVVQSTLPDGRRGTRIGCKLVVDKAKLEEIIRLFVVDLA